MNPNQEYKSKYLKYKAKYLNLLKSSNKLVGGNLNYIYDRKFGSEGNGDGQFDGPFKVIQLADGNIAVCDTRNNRVQIFDVSGNFIRKFGSQGNGDGQFYNPIGITQLADGNIAVSDTRNDRVQIFDVSGNFIRKFGSQGNGDGQFYNVFDVTQLADGNIAVCDTRKNRVQIFDVSGNFISKFGSPGDRDGQFNYPSGITQLADGNIAVCDGDNHRVQIFDVSGNFIRKFGSGGNRDGQFNYPMGITQLADGNIAVSDTNNRVQIFDVSGNFISKFGSPGDRNGQFNNPYGITKLADGNIAVCDSGNHRVQIFRLVEQEIPLGHSVNRNLFDTFEDVSDDDYKLINSVDLNDICPINIVRLKNGTYAMTELTNDAQIYIFEIKKDVSQDTSGNPISKYSINTLNSFGYDSFPTGSLPVDIIETIDNKLFILDETNNNVSLFDISGNYISHFGSGGLSNGQFNYPKSFTQLANTNIAVCDTENNRVQIFDISGNFIGKFGSKGSGDGQFNQPSGIIQLADGNIAVCEENNNRVQIFDTSGNFIGKIDSTDLEETAQKFEPYNLIQLDDESIAILDVNNVKIQIFDIDGNHISKIIISDNLNLLTITQLTDGVLAIATQDKNDNNKYSINFYSKIDKQQKTPIDIPDIPEVIRLIAYEPYMYQPTSSINYWNLCDEKKFNFILETETKYIDTQNPNYKKIKQITNPDVEKIKQLNEINIFNSLYSQKDIILTPNSKPFFIFYNIINGQRDAGIDAGGLTKTVFHELSKYLTSSNSPFFEKDEDTKLYGLKTYTRHDKDLHNNKLYFLGQLFGLAIKLKLTIEINLNPILLYQLTHTLSSNKITKELVSKIINELNPNLLNKTPYVCYNERLEQTYSGVCFYNEEGEQIEISDLEAETNKKISSSIKEHLNSNKYFIKGFRNQIDIKKSQIDRLPLNKLDELIAGISNTNLTIFNSHINFINFTTEQIDILKQIINQHIALSDEKTYLETLLLVMTGSNKIPAIGYPHSNKLRFELQGYIEPKPIDIHSCFNQFIINPRLLQEYIRASNKKETELYTTFDIQTLKGFTQDFSSA